MKFNWLNRYYVFDMRDEQTEFSEGVRKVEESEVSVVRSILANRYEILGVLGTGGMGNVYHGKAKFLSNKEVAIKVLHPEFANDATLLARFIREAELLRKVHHPRIVEVYEAASVAGITFYSMELVSGISLEQLIKDRSVPVSEIADIALKILDALNAIHTLGIIHRDLKPANIMITGESEVKLTDFGIARPENSQLTHHNEIVGSVCYIAPEIWIGEDPSPSVDLYSLGVVLFELATGDVPFDGNSPGDLMRKHLQSAPPDPSSLNPSLPFFMGKIILKLLAKQRHQRPSSAMEVFQMIRDNLEKKSEVKSFVAYRQDTSDFLQAVDSSASNLLSVAREDTPNPFILDLRGPDNGIRDTRSSRRSNTKPSIVNRKIVTLALLLFFAVALFFSLLFLNF